MADFAVLDAVLSRGFDDVMHFASFIQVGESVQHSAKYYQSNVVKTLALLDAMRAHGVGRFIFSSTAARSIRPLTSGIRSNRSIRMAAPS